MTDQDPHVEPDPTAVDARRQIEQLLGRGDPIELPDRSRALHDRRFRQETSQSKTLFAWALVVVSAQLVAADVVFGVYVVVELARGDGIPASVISAWLGATVIEVVGIVAIIARSLFPSDPKR